MHAMLVDPLPCGTCGLPTAAPKNNERSTWNCQTAESLIDGIVVEHRVFAQAAKAERHKCTVLFLSPMAKWGKRFSQKARKRTRSPRSCGQKNTKTNIHIGLSINLLQVKLMTLYIMLLPRPTLTLATVSQGLPARSQVH